MSKIATTNPQALDRNALTCSSWAEMEQKVMPLVVGMYLSSEGKGYLALDQGQADEMDSPDLPIRQPSLSNVRQWWESQTNPLRFISAVRTYRGSVDAPECFMVVFDQGDEISD